MKLETSKSMREPSHSTESEAQMIETWSGPEAQINKESLHYINASESLGVRVDSEGVRGAAAQG